MLLLVQILRREEVGTKLAMMSQRNMFHFLNGFGKSPLSEEMLLGAEGFLIACIDKSPKNAKTFDELRVSVFNTHSKALNLEKMPCSSTASQGTYKKSIYS